MSRACATYYAFYERLGRARDVRDAQRWTSNTDLYQAQGLNTSALISDLSDDDAATGLAEARRARALGSAPGFGATFGERGRVVTNTDYSQVLESAPELQWKLERV